MRDCDSRASTEGWFSSEIAPLTAEVSSRPSIKTRYVVPGEPLMWISFQPPAMVPGANAAKLIDVVGGALDVVLRAISLKQSSIRGYRNRRRALANPQIQVDTCHLSHGDGNSVADERGEAGCNHGDRILARGQLRNCIVSRTGCDGGVLRAHRDIG